MSTLLDPLPSPEWAVRPLPLYRTLLPYVVTLLDLLVAGGPDRGSDPS